ncbi:MAG: hypothetical protein ACRD5H_06720, partial [Nitrososphaerales archaeon]
GLTGNYQVSYTYNLAGQIKTITDNRFNTTATYTYNKAGELTGISGNGYGGVSQNNFTASNSSIWYRAWGGTKQLSYGNGLQINFSYNERLQPTQYRLQTGQLQVRDGSDYQYHDDGRVKFASNMVANSPSITPANAFDRAYNYDHVGRLAEALSGPEARGEVLPPSPPPPNNPYKQVNSYDVWGNLTGRTNRFWRTLPYDSATYSNNRRQYWSYDVAGNIAMNPTGNHTYDAVGRQTLTVSNLYIVGGGQTGHQQQPAIEIAQNYDGDGLLAKRVETKKTEEFIGGGPQTEITTTVTTTYYVTPRALGGQVMLELNATGGRRKSYVYVGNARIAEDYEVYEGSQRYIAWRHSNPVTGTALKTLDSGGVHERMEYDPFGAEVGNVDPYFGSEIPTYIDMRGDEPLYLEGGDPFDLSGGCELDGLPIACSDLLRRVEVGAVQAVGPKGIAGDVIHLGGGLIFGRYGTGSHLDDEGDRVTDYQYFYGQVKQNKPIVRIDPLPNNEFIFKNRAYEKEFYDILYEFVTNQDCVDQYKRIGIDIVDLLTNPKRGIRIGPGDLFRNSSYKMLNLQNRLGLTDAGLKNAIAASGYSFNAYAIGRAEFLVEKSLPTILLSATAVRLGREHLAKTFSHELIHAAGIRGRLLSQAERIGGSIYGGPQDKPNDLDHLNELDDIINTCTRRFKK